MGVTFFSDLNVSAPSALGMSSESTSGVTRDAVGVLGGLEASTGLGDLAELRNSCESDFKDWLMSLDGGKGALLQYMDSFSTEFDAELVQLCAAWRGQSCGQSLVECIDPNLWSAVGIHKLGHRLLL